MTLRKSCRFHRAQLALSTGLSIIIQEAKTALSHLIKRVLNGEEIMIAKAGKPVTRIVVFFAQILAQITSQAVKTSDHPSF